MRRITFLLASCLAFSASAVAQTEVTELTQLSNNKCYTITPKETSRGSWYYNASDPSMLYSTAVAKTQVNTNDPNQQFAFIKDDEGKYYLYSVGGKKFVQLSGDQRHTKLTNLPAGNEISFVKSTGQAAQQNFPWVVALDGKHIGISNNYTDCGGVITFWQSTNDGGNCIRITEAGSFDPAGALAIIKAAPQAEAYVGLPADAVGSYPSRLLDVINGTGQDFSADALTKAVEELKKTQPIAFDPAKTYTLQWHDGAGVKLISKEETPHRVYSSNKTSSLTTIENSDTWQVYQHDGKTYLYNLGAKGFLSYDGAANQWFIRPDQPAAIHLETVQAPYRYAIQDENFPGAYQFLHINASNSYPTGVVGWEKASTASQFYFVETETPAIDLSSVFEKALVAEVKAQAQAMIDSYDAAKADLVGALTAEQKTTLENLVNNSEINSTNAQLELDKVRAALKPEAGKYYRIENMMQFDDGQTKAIYPNADGENIAWASVDDSNVGMLWQFAQGTHADNYRVVNANTGKQIGKLHGSTNIVAHLVDNGVDYALDQRSATTYGLNCSYDGADGRMTLHTGTGFGAVAKAADEAGNYLGTYKAYGSTWPNTWQLRQVSSVSLKITDAGYATACYPFAVELPAGLEAYGVTAVGADRVVFTPLEGRVLAANEPVVLKGSADTYTMTIMPQDGARIGGNLLKGVKQSTDIAATERAFLLAEGSQGVAFYLLGDNNRTLAPNKAYLVVPVGAQAAPMLRLGSVTGIDGAPTDGHAASDCYDLQGRRVKSAGKGVHINNGRKVFIP